MKGWLGVLGAVALLAAAGCGSEIVGDGNGGEGGGGSQTGTTTTTTTTGTSTTTGTGTGTGTATATTTGPSFKLVYEGVLEPRSCTSPYCHGSFGGGGAVAEMHATYVGLVGGVADGPGCGNAKLVIPGQAEESMLYLKVAMAQPPCGKRMPASGVALTAAEIELIRDWIDGGANE